MKKILLIASCLLFACDNPTPMLIKPFVIIDKGWYEEANCEYVYQDKNGNRTAFMEAKNKYSVCDTLK